MSKTSYAVYQNNIGLGQALNAELGYEVLVNNLINDFDWLSTPQYFEN
jgi:hypothetical protein